MRRHIVLVCSALAGALALAAPTGAQTLDLFTISGDDNYSFTLPASPTSYMGTQPAVAFYIENVPGFPTTSGTADVVFYGDSLGGGLELLDPNAPTPFYVADSATLYTTPGGAPTFTPGTYTLDGRNYGFGISMLVISSISAVPEPATWALMIVGVGLSGAALRRKRLGPANAA